MNWFTSYFRYLQRTMVGGWILRFRTLIRRNTVGKAQGKMLKAQGRMDQKVFRAQDKVMRGGRGGQKRVGPGANAPGARPGSQPGSAPARGPAPPGPASGGGSTAAKPQPPTSNRGSNPNDGWGNDDGWS